MNEIAGFLGWIGAIGYGMALLNFFMKYVNKKYINKLPKEKNKFITIYRKIMKYVVKYHKIFGIVASIAIVIHLYLMYTNIGLSITGLAAAIVMWSIFSLGIYGVLTHQKAKGNWIKIHRLLSFLLILLLVAHLLLKL